MRQKLLDEQRVTIQRLEGELTQAATAQARTSGEIANIIDRIRAIVDDAIPESISGLTTVQAVQKLADALGSRQRCYELACDDIKAECRKSAMLHDELRECRHALDRVNKCDLGRHVAAIDGIRAALGAPNASLDGLVRSVSNLSANYSTAASHLSRQRENAERLNDILIKIRKPLADAGMFDDGDHSMTNAAVRAAECVKQIKAQKGWRLEVSEDGSCASVTTGDQAQ
jgi:hypothetical protein